MLLEYKYAGYKSTVDYVFGELTEDQERNLTDYVYIGSSHMGIIGEYHPNENFNVKNYAFQGLDLFKQYSILRKWLPKMNNIKGVLICLDYELIGHNQTISGEPHLDRQFYRYTDTLYANNLTNRIFSELNFFRANRDLNYLSQKNHTYIPKEKHFNDFIPVDSRNNLTDINCIKRAKELSQIKFKKTVVEENLLLLEFIIELCNKLDIKVTFFNPPKRLCYRKNVNETNIAYAKEKIYEVLKQHNAYYYDFYDDEDFNDSDFVDYDHLNSDGAKKLINKIFK